MGKWQRHFLIFSKLPGEKKILKPKVWRWVKMVHIPMKPSQTICIIVGLNFKGPFQVGKVKRGGNTTFDNFYTHQHFTEFLKLARYFMEHSGVWWVIVSTGETEKEECLFLGRRLFSTEIALPSAKLHIPNGQSYSPLMQTQGCALCVPSTPKATQPEHLISSDER